MSKRWDYDVPSVELWREVLRVLKPGGTLLSFAGSRTQHRMAVNIEDAGFHLKDTLLWLYGQGFPKGADIGKQLDKLAGARREVLGCVKGAGAKDLTSFGNGHNSEYNATAPATDAAKQWDGWKSHALKPAYEPIIMAMKPNDGSYAANALTHGVAGLNIDACRVPSPGENITTHARSAESEQTAHPAFDFKAQETHQRAGQALGRYPANILHDGSDEVLAGFPETKSGKLLRHHKMKASENNCMSGPNQARQPRQDSYGDEGSAARFFYCTKANKKNRGEGNNHPTVKPQALMRWLVRLVCPADGVVLDPFMGSGTTGVVCAAEGFAFMGFERDQAYFDIARGRLVR